MDLAWLMYVYVGINYHSILSASTQIKLFFNQPQFFINLHPFMLKTSKEDSQVWSLDVLGKEQCREIKLTTKIFQIV
jgi:hypothetical protein